MNSNATVELDSYILEGGFTKTLSYPALADKRAYTTSAIKEIFEKDIRARVKIKSDSVFNQVRGYIIINNFSTTTSLTNI